MYLSLYIGILYLKRDLDYLGSIWDNHLLDSHPIQYLCGRTFWRDLKLKVTNKVLIPRPETELIVDIVFKIFEQKSQKLFFHILNVSKLNFPDFQIAKFEYLLF